MGSTAPCRASRDVLLLHPFLALHFVQPRRGAFEHLRVLAASYDFQLRLYPNARISGHITGKNGEPVQGVTVQLMSAKVEQGRKKWGIKGIFKTGSDRAFKINDLRRGHYILLAASHPLPAMVWNAPPEVSAPAYYPDSEDMSSAQIIDLKAGQDFLADFHVRRERGYRVVVPFSSDSPYSPRSLTISIRNSSGETIPFAGVHYDSKLGQIITPPLPPGTWLLQAIAWEGQGRLSAGEEINVDHLI